MPPRKRRKVEGDNVASHDDDMSELQPQTQSNVDLKALLDKAVKSGDTSKLNSVPEKQFAAVCDDTIIGSPFFFIVLFSSKCFSEMCVMLHSSCTLLPFSKQSFSSQSNSFSQLYFSYLSFENRRTLMQ
jgi:hypothetical protein